MSYNVTRHPQFKIIFDPAIGTGRLTDPWYDADCTVYGCDIVDGSAKTHGLIKGRFEDCTWYDDWPTPDLVLCNPPFNGAPGKRLYNEVFLEHIIKLFGPKIPVVMFAAMGTRLNQRRKSKRWRWLRDCGAEITSIVSLPLDIFDDVEFHNEILMFNVQGVKPHYLLPESAL
jgi:type I restriction enzyme M protein